MERTIAALREKGHGPKDESHNNILTEIQNHLIKSVEIIHGEISKNRVVYSEAGGRSYL